MHTDPFLPLVVLPGVYAPQDDTRLLLRALGREGLRPGSTVLDLGSGTGALAVAAARCGARVTAVDISWPAVFSTRLNAWLWGQRVRVHRRDMAVALADRAFDVLVANPPYVPVPGGRPARSGGRAWDAGCDGRRYIDRICDAAPRALRTGGVLLMVHSALCGTRSTLARLTAAGLRATAGDPVAVPLGPVLRSRYRHLRRQGLLSPAQKTEELVIIRAEQP
ncbi:HemK2/MTQ2 family protein methyltransferase [Streptomyces catenulae]|uniref:HemK2/MTQ2 family protein methyltransferase n=1 Tax=Streptomyces catenulae TaxID=66875 RepID=A0ABV2YSS7_9ACTN|nr:HemK2/MTQ2 family protein methyltransferase [Streptomyces catenulae]